MAAPVYTPGSGAAKSMAAMSGKPGPEPDVSPPKPVNPLAPSSTEDHLAGQHDKSDALHGQHVGRLDGHDAQLGAHHARLDRHRSDLNDHAARLGKLEAGQGGTAHGGSDGDDGS